jgi:DNA-binding MarR family transcriptional regulator
MFTESKNQTSEEIELRSKLLEIRGRCTCVNLKKATRAVSHIVDQHVRPAGLRTGQFSILVNVANNGSVRVGDLADELVMDVTTLSRNIRLLERDGYVNISSGNDKRVREITLTDCGLKKIAEILPLWEKAQSTIKHELGEENWDMLISQLRQVAKLKPNS